MVAGPWCLRPHRYPRRERPPAQRRLGRNPAHLSRHARRRLPQHADGARPAHRARQHHSGHLTQRRISDGMLRFMQQHNYTHVETPRKKSTSGPRSSSRQAKHCCPSRSIPGRTASIATSTAGPCAAFWATMATARISGGRLTRSPKAVTRNSRSGNAPRQVCGCRAYGKAYPKTLLEIVLERSRQAVLQRAWPEARSTSQLWPAISPFQKRTPRPVPLPSLRRRSSGPSPRSRLPPPRRDVRRFP